MTEYDIKEKMKEAEKYGLDYCYSTSNGTEYYYDRKYKGNVYVSIQDYLNYIRETKINDILNA